MSELTPVPKGMCPAFYQFMGAGSPRSDSGEILMLKNKEAPDPTAELVAKAREAVKDIQQLASQVLDFCDPEKLGDDSDGDPCFKVGYACAAAERTKEIADSLAAALDAYEKGGAK